MLFAGFVVIFILRIFLFVYKKTRRTAFAAAFAVIMAAMAVAVKAAVWGIIDLIFQAVSALF